MSKDRPWLWAARRSSTAGEDASLIKKSKETLIPIARRASKACKALLMLTARLHCPENNWVSPTGPPPVDDTPNQMIIVKEMLPDSAWNKRALLCQFRGLRPFKIESRLYLACAIDAECMRGLKNRKEQWRVGELDSDDTGWAGEDPVM